MRGYQLPRPGQKPCLGRYLARPSISSFILPASMFKYSFSQADRALDPTHIPRGNNMNIKAFIATTVLSSIVLSGCSTTSQLAVRPETTSKINKIALIKVAEPESYLASDLGSPGMMLGGIGGAIAGASSANAGKNLQQITQESGFKAGERLTRVMQKQLTVAGYRVTLIEAPRDESGKLIKDYANVNAGDADAIMDVAIENIGYATEHPMFSPHWRPASTVHVNMIDSRTHEKLYAEKFMYGYHNPLMSGTDLEASGFYHFKNKDAMFSDSSKLVKGMEHSVESVSRRVSKNLKK